jgi:phosphate transport system permease protein
VTTIAPERPVTMSPEERRETIQATARRFYRRKMVYSRLFVSMMALGLLVALGALAMLLEAVISRGMRYISWSFLTSPPQLADLFHRNRIGGISNALVGTLVVFGLGFLIAVPLSIIVAVALYESSGKVMAGFRTLLEVMVGMPSILFGIFIFAYIVSPDIFHSGYVFNGFAGSLALAVLMVPLMSVTCEQALRAVPLTYTEAALALGAKRAKIMRKVTMPYALPRMVTGIMLSASRGVGETAPLLFTIGASMLVNFSPRSQQTTASTDALNSISGQYIIPTQVYEVWGVALVLITVVLILNVSSRIIVARLNRGRV